MADNTQPEEPAEDVRPIDPNPGSELNPANFVGRSDVDEMATTMLKAKQNILLGDPRRMGKSFWIVTFMEKMNRIGAWRVVFIDYQGVDTIEEFLRMTVEHLTKSQRVSDRFLQYVSGLFDNIDAEAALGPITLKKAVRESGTQPAQVLENILIRLDQDMQANDTKTPLVIAMDEVADAVLSIASHDVAAAVNLLRRLRHLRHAASHIRWIVAGSVGIHHVLTKCDIGEDVINDLDNLPFGPLNPADSASLARRLALGIHRPIDADAVATMYALTDGIPYLIQKLSDLMRYGDHHQHLNSKITATEVEARFAEFLNDRDQSRDVTQFVSRIDRYYGDDAATAFAILDWITAGPPEGRQQSDIPESISTLEGFARTLRNLIDDHYLTISPPEAGGRLAWRYQAIRTIYLHRRPTKG